MASAARCKADGSISSQTSGGQSNNHLAGGVGDAGVQRGAGFPFQARPRSTGARTSRTGAATPLRTAARSRMKVIVTCGPSFEPIDEVRRLTNFSTGELGALLAEQLGAAGHEVFCLKGSGATHPGPAPGPGCLVRRFDTNDDLLALLREISSAHGIGAVFHAAALCDYRVAAVRDDAGNACQSAKIASRSGALTLQLSWRRRSSTSCARSSRAACSWVGNTNWPAHATRRWPRRADNSSRRERTCAC